MSDRIQLLLAETGQFGPFQRRLFAVSVVVIIIASFRISEYVFTTTRISTRCVIKECEDPGGTQFTPEWLSHAVPIIDGHFDNCRRFARAANASASTDGSCPAVLFDTNTTVACESYVYENQDTVAYDFRLACDEWYRSLIGSARMSAMLVGLPLVGFASDHWGRRPTLIVCELLAACLGVMRYWSTSYGGYVTLVFFESALGCGQYACVFILLMETVGLKYRGAAGAIANLLFSLGMVLLALIAWAVPNWRTLTFVLYSPQLLAFCYYWIVPESIRWNLSKGNYAAAEATLRKVAHMNGKKLSEESLRELRQAAEEKRQHKVENYKEKEPWLVIQVFQIKPILLRCVVLPMLWITMMLIYYGLSVYTANMFGNKYLNFAVVTAAEIPGCLLAMTLMNYIDRRYILVVSYWVCASCQTTYIVLPKGMFVVSVIVYLIGKLFIAVVSVTLYVYTSELFPTRYRQNFLNFSAMSGKIGGSMAPLTPAFAAVWAPMPFVLFASLAVVSGLLVLVLPETRGTVLPDTMQQAARLVQAQNPRANEDFGLLADRNRPQSVFRTSQAMLSA